MKWWESELVEGVNEEGFQNRQITNYIVTLLFYNLSKSLFFISYVQIRTNNGCTLIQISWVNAYVVLLYKFKKEVLKLKFWINIVFLTNICSF